MKRADGKAIGGHVVTFYGGRQLGDELEALFKDAYLERCHEDNSGICQWDVKIPEHLKDTAHEALKRNSFRVKGV